MCESIFSPSTCRLSVRWGLSSSRAVEEDTERQRDSKLEVAPWRFSSLTASHFPCLCNQGGENNTFFLRVVARTECGNAHQTPQLPPLPVTALRTPRSGPSVIPGEVLDGAYAAGGVVKRSVLELDCRGSKFRLGSVT